MVRKLKLFYRYIVSENAIFLGFDFVNVDYFESFYYNTIYRIYENYRTFVHKLYANKSLYLNTNIHHRIQMK